MHTLEMQNHYKYLTILSALYIAIPLIAVALTYRLVNFGGFIFHGGSFIFPLSYILGDVIVEVYGYKIIRQLIWASIICGYLFAIISTIMIKLPSPIFWHGQGAFVQVFGNSFRFVFLTSIGGFIGSFVNAYCISKSKIFMKGQHFWLRSFFSSTTGEVVQTVFVIPFAFAGVVPLLQIITVMITAFSLKVMYNILTMIPANYLARFLKKKEKIDVYDFDTKFTPFIL